MSLFSHPRALRIPGKLSKIKTVFGLTADSIAMRQYGAGPAH